MILTLSIPALLAGALWMCWRASLSFGAAGVLTTRPGPILPARVAWLRGMLGLLAALFLAVAGGFVWGRLA